MYRSSAFAAYLLPLVACWFACLEARTDVADVAKQVVSTPWWPPGTEKEYESIGIISHGYVYMTSMMEVNTTLKSIEAAIASDIADIAHAANATLDDLVDCIVNAPTGWSAAVRTAFLQALPGASKPAVTVIEMPGEAPIIPTSASCIAALPAKGPAARREVRKDAAYGIAARGLLHIQEVTGTAHSPVGVQVKDALSSIDALVLEAGGKGIEDLVDCIAFVTDIGHAAAARDALNKTKATPALTMVQAGLQGEGHDVALRCVAALGSGRPHKLHNAMATSDFVFASGVAGRLSNGTDAFRDLEAILKPAGASLSDVLSCTFFMKHPEKVVDLFAGFKQVFNVEHPPPPTRNELVSVSECSQCEVQMKCVAALKHEVKEAILV